MNVHAVWVGPVNASVQKSIDALKSKCRADTFFLHQTPDLLPRRWMPVYEDYCTLSQMKADLIRLAALRQHGGIYFDLDVSLVSSPRDIARRLPPGFSVACLDPAPFLGGDIILCDKEYPHWDQVDDYIAGFIGNTGPRSFIAFTHYLFAFLGRQDAINVVCDKSVFPYRASDFCESSLVCRGFDEPKPGLGDHVASALSAVGITKERVSKALGRPCACPKRQQKMNDWGRKWLGIGGPG